MKIECIGLKYAQPFYNAHLKNTSAFLVRFQSQEIRETRGFSFPVFLAPLCDLNPNFWENRFEQLH